jgi:hypothetical protein
MIYQIIKKNNSRKDAKPQRIFLCVLSAAADEKKKLTLAKQERRKGFAFGR